MRFYLHKYVNNAWNWVEVQVEIEPNLTRAWDTTNDSFTCVLGVNTDAEPYKPMTAFKIVDDNNNNTIMWINNDNVTICSLSPLCYKHQLTLVQYRYFLNKHLVRNTVFNQPKISKQKLYTAVNAKYHQYGSDYYYVINYDIYYQPISWADKTILNPHSKVKNIVLEYSFYYVRGTDEEDSDSNPVAVTLTQLKADSVFSGMNSTLRNNTYIKICDANNSDTTIYTVKIFDYEKNKQVPLPSAAVSAINSYIASRGNNPVHLYGKYDAALDSGESSINPIITRCFLKTINTTLQGEVDTDIFKPIVLQVNLTFDVYNYTMYDLIDTLLKQYRLTDHNNVSKRESLFNLPVSGDLYDLLTNTYPPDTMSFTQATFYDALTEIFRFYDAGFKFDENKTLQIEYYNDLQQERDDISFSGKTMSFSERNLNNGRVAYYQNSVQNIDLPYTQTRANSVGVPEKTDYCIIVPKPIYALNKLTMRLSGTNIRLCGSNNMSKLSMDVDLTPFVVNRSVWSVLDKISNPLTASDYQKLYQEDTIPFDRGSNLINVSTYHKDWAGTENAVLGFVMDIAVRRFFGQPDQESTVYYDSFQSGAKLWQNHVFSINYDSLVNGRLETKTLNDQYEGETIVNQSSGMIDISKLGLNMLGESLKDGQPILTLTCEMTDWNDKINEGDYIIYNGNKWVANVVNYKPVKDGVYQCSVQFTKNFNALSLRVATDREKRLTAISGEQATLSEDSYVDYVYVSDGTMMPTRETTIFDNNIIESLVGQTFGISANGYSVKNVDVASIITYGSNGQINTFGNLGWTSSNIVIPLIKYGAGNCLCFEVQYDSPISAGNSLVYSSGSYRSYAILYTDDEGWGDLVSVRFHQESGVVYNHFPTITSATDIAIIDRLKYYKKPNEIFGLNYELCFLPILSQINDFFIGNAFIKNNFFVSTQKMKRNFYLYYDNNYKYSVLDTKGHGSRVSVNFSTISTSTVVWLYILTSSTITANSWAICDENGDIYFASNNQKTFTNYAYSSESIVFTTRRTKMTDQDELVAIPSEPGLAQTYTFNVEPDDWEEHQAYWNISVSAQVSSIAIYGDNQKLATGSGTYQSLILIGKTLEYLSISQGDYPYNSVSFDSATGTFSYTIYEVGDDFSIGDEIDATITYKVTGTTARCIYGFEEVLPELVSQTLSNITITPASNVGDYPNVINFDPTTGTFKGRVYKASKPTTTTTYTITYTIS